MNLYTYTRSPEGSAATFEAAAAAPTEAPASEAPHERREVWAVRPFVDVVVEDVVRRRAATFGIFRPALATKLIPAAALHLVTARGLENAGAAALAPPHARVPQILSRRLVHIFSSITRALMPGLAAAQTRHEATSSTRQPRRAVGRRPGHDKATVRRRAPV